jgi:hypothetical protein
MLELRAKVCIKCMATRKVLRGAHGGNNVCEVMERQIKPRKWE